MIVEVSREEYKRHFSTDPHIFINDGFIANVENKCDRVVRFMKDDESSIGLILGIKDGVAKSPFSAPFGGFHYSHEYLFYNIVHDFISDLKDYIASQGLKAVQITLPPDLYQINMNAKLVNAFIRLGFTMENPDITHWADLKNFDGTWTKNMVTQNCRKAVKHGLTWSLVTDMESKKEAYEVILQNREQLGRKIYMTFDDLLGMEHIVPVDFFLVRESNGNGIGAGIFYRGHEKIVIGIFLGDDMEKRNLGTMNFLYKNLYEYYKEMGFSFLDLGISGLAGEPNAGLVRFKELHNCIASLRHTLSWTP